MARIPIRCELLRRDELEDFARVDWYGKPVDLLKARLDECQTCFVAKHDGRIVAGWWIETGSARSTGLGRAFPLAAGEAHGHSAFTLPEYRGQRIMPALLGFADSRLAQTGILRVVSLVDSSNRASIRAHAAAGRRRAGSVGYMDMFKWRWYFCWVRGAFGRIDHPHYLVKM